MAVAVPVQGGVRIVTMIVRGRHVFVMVSVEREVKHGPHHRGPR